MHTLKHAQLLVLAGSLAGMVSCTPTKQAEEAHENQVDNMQQARTDTAKLTQEQHDESVELARKQAEQQRELAANTAKDRDEAQEEAASGDMKAARQQVAKITDKQTDLVADQRKDRDKLANEHTEERADLAKDQVEQRTNDANKVAQADTQANAARASLVQDSREKLNKLDKRAADLQAKAATAKPADKPAVTTDLNGYATKREAADRDIEALNDVTAANLNRAKEQVRKELASLDKTLDQVESKL